MSQNRLPDYLEQMQQASTDACSFLIGFTKDDFLADKRTQQAITMNLIILGEAVTRIMDGYPDFVQKHPEVPWREMRGIRNQVAHAYFELDLNVVWETIQNGLPALLKQLAYLYDEINDSH